MSNTLYPATVGELRRFANANGSYFFSPGTMRFFNSKVNPRDRIVYTPTSDDERGYFLTSEKFEDEPREYAVRVFQVVRDDSGGVTRIEFDRIGDWHPTRESAMAALKSIAGAH